MDDAQHEEFYKRIRNLEITMGELKTEVRIEIPNLKAAVDSVKRWQIGTVTAIILGVLALLFRLSAT